MTVAETKTIAGKGESDASIAASRCVAQGRDRPRRCAGCGRNGRNARGPGLSRCLWQARLARRPGGDPRYGVLDRLDDQGDHLDGGDAARRTRKAIARLADLRGIAGTRSTTSARRVRRYRRADAAPGAAADNFAASAYPYRRVRLRHLEPRYGPATWRRCMCQASSPTRTLR